jgi:CheY-like chemotaxis protein
LVEDESDEADFLQTGFAESRCPLRVDVKTDTWSTLLTLRNGAPRPELILLDIDRPDLNGMRLLHQVKTDRELRHIPVIALTAQDDPERLKETYGAYVTACVRKPMDLAEYRSLAEAISRFWFDWAVLCK